MTTSDRPASRLALLLGRPLWVAGLYLVLTLVLTYPLGLHFATALPGGTNDVWSNYWNFWWWKFSLLELHQSPYHTKFLFHPTGASLVFHTHSPFNMLVSLPVNVVWGPAAAYNFCSILGFWLSGWGAFLLAREVTGDARGAFLAGIVFAFFPQHFEQTLEHLNLATTQFIPFTFYYLLRLRREGGWRNVLGLGASFAFCAMCGWHLGITLALILAPIGLVFLVRGPRPKLVFARELALAALAATLIALPHFGPMLVEALWGFESFTKPEVNEGVDLAFLFWPAYGHPLFKPLVAPAYASRFYASAGFVAYLGFVPVALAAWAAWRRQAGFVFWGLVFLVTLIFALGAHPLWNGHLIESIDLPGILIREIPGIRVLRSANRFLIFTSLALGVLVALGWSALRKQSDARFALIAGVILFEYLWTPFPIQEVVLAPIYGQLARADGTGAVLDIPFLQRSRSARHNMVAQTIHHRPIAGGHVAVDPIGPIRAIQNEPALADLARIPKLERPIDRKRLLELGFDWMILHKTRAESFREAAVAATDPLDLVALKRAQRLGGIPDEKLHRIREQLEALTGGPSFEDAEIVVFDLRRMAR